jgi:hypothetical protein
MTLTRSQVGRSIAAAVRAATNFNTVWAVRSRPISREEAEAWSLRTQERRAKVKAEANATSWPLSE